MPDINYVKDNLKDIVKDLISHEFEEEWFEFKENWFEPVELGQYISAMSNGPMFTGFRDRIEILSRGTLPPKQTVDGFYAGESVPVNEALSKIFIQLHITEHTGRGIPKITSVYGKDNINIKENNIVVTIPYERIDSLTSTLTEVASTQVNSENVSVDDKILSFCVEPKSIIEIANFLGYKERKTVRKYVAPLLEIGRIAMTVPDKPNSRNQKYVTIK